ncbi:MAG: hypothetical protein HC831_08290 [Chloroflexia bacterium]|nr:hypothetical protein [Chloroflexia bacterium]
MIEIENSTEEEARLMKIRGKLLELGDNLNNASLLAAFLMDLIGEKDERFNDLVLSMADANRCYKVLMEKKYPKDENGI